MLVIEKRAELYMYIYKKKVVECESKRSSRDRERVMSESVEVEGRVMVDPSI